MAKKQLRKRKTPTPARPGNFFIFRRYPFYYYGRVLECNPMYSLVEFFDLTSREILAFDQVLNRARRPILQKHVYTHPAFGRQKWGYRWQVIGHQRLPENFRYPSFRMGGTSDWMQVKTGNKTTRVSKRRARKYEPLILFEPARIEERLALGVLSEWPETVENDAFEYESD